MIQGATTAEVQAANAATGACERVIWAAFDRAAREFPEQDFLHTPAAGEAASVTLRYGEARAAVEQLCVRLSAAGFIAGHRVALALDNRPEFFLSLLALNRLGCSAVPLNAGMSREELHFVLTHADVAAIVALDAHLNHIAAAAPDGAPVISASRLHASLPSPAGPPQAALDEAALLYTSGTTGTPKGCILTQAYFHQIGALYTGLGGYCSFRRGEERLITPLPVTHMNALGCSLMAMLLTGGCLIQLDRFHPSRWLRSLRETRATCFHYLGVMPAMLLGAPVSPEDDLRGVVRFGFGAGVDPRHHAAFEARFGAPLIEAWAMTETGGAGWITANHEPRCVGERCFGRAPAGLEWRLIDESGAQAPPGEPGELLVRTQGPDPRRGFFGGYYKDAAATEAAWAGGWFHTGDIVRVDANGSFFFVDRLKNVIRRSGENIAAIEVESALLQHPTVRACAVTAAPDEIRGEEVFAFIVPQENVSSRQTARRLQEHCLDALAYYKAPGYFAFVDELPQTASQKLARAEVKRRAAALVDGGGAIDVRAGKKRRASAAG